MGPSAVVITGTLTCAIGALALAFRSVQHRERERRETLIKCLTDTEKQLVLERAKRAADRKGRVRAERALRTAHMNNHPSGLASMQPIGILRSVFKDRRGTPRQSLLCSDARARLEFSTDVQPECSLEGLSAFSHVWLIGVFHENTDVARKGFKAKIKPPRLDGEKIGVFATRTPHRPNPFSLSIAKIESIEPNGVLILSGVDLVDGTPIVDIKPYVPRYDSLPDASCASWIDTETGVFAAVNFSLEAEASLHSLISEMEFFRHVDPLRSLIRQVLRRDIRNLNQRMLHDPIDLANDMASKSYLVRLDRLVIYYKIDERSVVLVHSIVLDAPVNEVEETDERSRSPSPVRQIASNRDSSHESSVPRAITPMR